MSPQILDNLSTNIFYDLLSLPFDRNINNSNQVISTVDLNKLDPELKSILLSLPMVQYTGDFKAGGLDPKQRLYLMSELDDIFFIDTLHSNYAQCVTKLTNVPDLSDKEITFTGINEDKNKIINLVKKSESYSLTYDEIEYIIEIVNENDGTFTSIQYGDNFVMDTVLEKEILEFFYKNK
tara:strand:- start:1 stop:540 length:540 start_codon:yes stop_codon:yes gene_type:complete